MKSLIKPSMKSSTIPLLFFGSLLFQMGCSDKPTLPPAPSDKAVIPAVSANEHWSREIIPDPEWGSPEYEETAWSPSQIAEYHEKLLLKPLPGYATDLKGAGMWERQYKTLAVWCFYFPENRLPDFETYLEEVGVPRDSFLKDTIVSGSDAIQNAKQAQATKKLLFCGSVISKADGHMRNGVILKKGDSVNYKFINPDVPDITIDFTVDRRKKYVYIREYGPFKD